MFFYDPVKKIITRNPVWITDSARDSSTVLLFIVICSTTVVSTSQPTPPLRKMKGRL